MSNLGFISKKRIAREIAKMYKEYNGHDMFSCGNCSALNGLCSRLNIKPMHRNKQSGGTGEMLGKDDE